VANAAACAESPLPIGSLATMRAEIYAFTDAKAMTEAVLGSNLSTMETTVLNYDVGDLDSFLTSIYQ